MIILYRLHHLELAASEYWDRAKPKIEWNARACARVSEERNESQWFLATFIDLNSYSSGKACGLRHGGRRFDSCKVLTTFFVCLFVCLFVCSLVCLCCVPLCVSITVNFVQHINSAAQQWGSTAKQQQKELNYSFVTFWAQALLGIELLTNQSCEFKWKKYLVIFSI